MESIHDTSVNQGPITSNLKKDSTIKVITDISENNDTYSWVELNCFYKPWAILFESFHPGYFDLFLFYVSYYSIYKPDGWFLSKFENEPIYELFIRFYETILEKKFGLCIKTVYFADSAEMHQKIINEIDNNSRALIPIDLIELYYNTQYKRESNAHFIILKGYDLERELYFILDNMHIDGGASTIYKDFSLRFADLYKMNVRYSTDKNFTGDYKAEGKSFFWSLNRVKDASFDSVSIYNALLDYLNLLSGVESNGIQIKYLESEILNHISQKKDIKSLGSAFSTLNFKPVFYDLLSKFLVKADIEKKQIDEVEDYKNSLLKSWQKIKNKIIYFLAKNNTSLTDLNELIRLYIEEEKSFRRKCIHVISQIYNLYNDTDKINSTIAGCDFQNEFVEINHNNATIIKAENKIQMIHSDGKRYDTWLMHDNAPQLLTFLKGSKQFSLEAKVKVFNEIGYPFHSGIIIKLADGSKLLYGNHRGKELSLFCPENSNTSMLCIKPYFDDEVYLKVEQNASSLIFWNKINKADSWEKFHEITSTESVLSLGVFSKTWETINHKAEFSEIRYSAIDSI